jgi:hypothetical protein
MTPERHQRIPSPQLKSPDSDQDAAGAYENFYEETICPSDISLSPASEIEVQLAVGSHEEGLSLTRELLARNMNINVTSGVVQRAAENTGCGSDVMQLLLDSHITTITNRAARLIALSLGREVVEQLLQKKDRIGLSEDVVDLIMLRLQWETSSHRNRDRTTETPGAMTAVDPMHLVDPVSYFSFLDDLELKVATRCNFKVHELQQGGFRLDLGDYALEDCRSDIDGIMKAVLLLLEGEGLFNLQFNIIAQDWRRYEEKGSLVARVIPVPFLSLLKLEQMVGDDMESTSQIENTNISRHVEELRNELKALDIDTSQGKPMHGPSSNVFIAANFYWWVDIPPSSNREALAEFLGYFRLLCSVFKLGLLSYSGSHSCPFNETVFGQNGTTTFQHGESYVLRQKRLRCLDKFIDGPVWVFEKGNVPDDGYCLSLTIQEFARLWGPVWAVPCASDPDKISLIYTEGGVIQGSGWTDRQEVYCHWTPTSLGPIDRTNLMPFLATFPLLLGAPFHTNANCQKNIVHAQNELACLFLFPGVSKDCYEFDTFGIQAAGGYFITAGAYLNVRRRPGTKLKSRIVEYCRDPNVDLTPILKLRVGLEVSVCTGNAQRISLWEALRLTSVFSGSTSDVQPRISQVATCTHQIGDILCVQECWVHSVGTNPIANMDVRAVILRALFNLQFTGLDNDNALLLWWPFTQEPNALQIKDTSTSKHNWIHMLKDARDSATFAVTSPRCLEYECVSTGNELKVWRRCLDSRENQTLLRDFDERDMNRTLLYTTLQLHSTPCDPRNVSHTNDTMEPGPDRGQTIGVVSTHTTQLAFDQSTINVGSQVEIDGIGTLQVMNEEHPPLTLLRKKFDMLEKMTGHLFKRDKRQKHRELISAEKAVGPTMDVIVM